jgi:16S rRNA (cytosine1402-N4)-methyltransferase
MHEPVLLNEVVEHLVQGPGGCYLDGTLGGAGHARALLERAGPESRLLGLDRDGVALELARQNLAGFSPARVVLVRGNFSDMKTLAAQHGFTVFDGILLDLGVSSMQLDMAERGFSFQHDAELDMRMDTRSGPTAADLVNTLSESELADLIWKLGEDRDARRIARQLVAARDRVPLRRTGELADLVERAKGGRRGRIHPATQTFQALRMAVNQELESLAQGLDSALELLAPGGRLGVITFHSLEDRLVKQTMVAHVPREESLAAGGVRRVVSLPEVKWRVRKPLIAKEEEVARNPRSRSAKWRVVERTREDGTQSKS